MKLAIKPPSKIPKTLYRFFWDVDPARVNPARRPYYVINRLLDKGDLAAARWVRRHMPEKLIIETLKTVRDFSPRTIYFWSNYYNISKEEIKCMQEPYLSMRRMHWAY